MKKWVLHAAITGRPWQWQSEFTRNLSKILSTHPSPSEAMAMYKLLLHFPTFLESTSDSLAFNFRRLWKASCAKWSLETPISRQVPQTKVNVNTWIQHNVDIHQPLANLWPQHLSIQQEGLLHKCAGGFPSASAVSGKQKEWSASLRTFWGKLFSVTLSTGPIHEIEILIHVCYMFFNCKAQLKSNNHHLNSMKLLLHYPGYAGYACYVLSKLPQAELDFAFDDLDFCCLPAGVWVAPFAKSRLKNILSLWWYDIMIFKKYIYNIHDNIKESHQAEATQCL